MLLLRANALCVGVSGVRPLLVEMMIEMLNKGVTPIIPQKGSLGSSGDWLLWLTCPCLCWAVAAPSSRAWRCPAPSHGQGRHQDLDTLVSKEGLGLTNGTCAMTSVGSLALYDTICAAQLGDIIGSMDFEA